MDTEKRIKMQKRIDESCLALRSIPNVENYVLIEYGVAITLDDKPLMVIGSWDETESHRIANDLVKNPIFRVVLNKILELRIHDFDKELQIVKYKYDQLPKNNVFALTVKDAQKPIKETDETMLIAVMAILPSSEFYDPKRLGFALCLDERLEDVFKTELKEDAVLPQGYA